MEILGSEPSQVTATKTKQKKEYSLLSVYPRVMGLRHTTHYTNTEINHNLDLP